MKKIVALACALLMLASCTAFAEETDRLGGLTLPLVEEETTVQLFCYSLFEQTEDTWLFQKIKERTGITIDPLCYTKDVFAEKLSTFIASAELPDIIAGGLSQYELNTYGDQGAFACVDDYLELTPNVKRIFFDDEENAMMFKWYASQETGNNYSYPVYMLNRDVNFGFMYRADVFEQLGIEPWTDTESFYDALVAIKAAYPDSYPYGNKAGIGMIDRWMTYYDLTSIPVSYDYDNMQWYMGCVTDNFREGLDLLKKMYDNALLDPEFMTDSLDTWNAKYLNDKCFVMNDWIGRMALLEGEGCKTNEAWDLDYARPIGNGKMQALSKFTDWGVTVAQNDKTEVSVKLVDYLYSDEGSEMNTKGIEGDNLTIAEDGTLVYNDIEDAADINKLEEKYGMWIEPLYLRPDRTSVYYAFTEDEQFAQDLINNECGYTRYSPAMFFVSAEAEEQYSLLAGELRSKMETFAGNYITDAAYGDDQWNEWVETVNSTYTEQMLSLLK